MGTEILDRLSECKTKLLDSEGFQSIIPPVTAQDAYQVSAKPVTGMGNVTSQTQPPKRVSKQPPSSSSLTITTAESLFDPVWNSMVLPSGCSNDDVERMLSATGDVAEALVQLIQTVCPVGY